jgi:hypothetical protein
MGSDANDISVTRFCALVYRTGRAESPSAPERVVILFLGGPGGSLRVLTRRDWRNMVSSEDVEYVQALMDDFRERARSTPDPLFKQVSSLSVGPLVTYAVGAEHELGTFSSLVDICKDMVDL